MKFIASLLFAGQVFAISPPVPMQIDLGKQKGSRVSCTGYLRSTPSKANAGVGGCKAKTGSVCLLGSEFVRCSVHKTIENVGCSGAFYVSDAVFEKLSSGTMDSEHLGYKISEELDGKGFTSDEYMKKTVAMTEERMGSLAKTKVTGKLVACTSTADGYDHCELSDCSVEIP